MTLNTATRTPQQRFPRIFAGEVSLTKPFSESIFGLPGRNSSQHTGIKIASRVDGAQSKNKRAAPIYFK